MTAPPAPREPRTSEVELRVRYAETDKMGIVYHANYLVWCDIGRTEHLRASGTSYRDLEHDGILLAVAEASLRYRASARYDDRIRIRTTITGVGSRSIHFEYTIANADSGETLATARTLLVSTDESGRVRAMPRALRQALARDAALEAEPGA